MGHSGVGDGSRRTASSLRPEAPDLTQELAPAGRAQPARGGFAAARPRNPLPAGRNAFSIVVHLGIAMPCASGLPCSQSLDGEQMDFHAVRHPLRTEAPSQAVVPHTPEEIVASDRMSRALRVLSAAGACAALALTLSSCSRGSGRDTDAAIGPLYSKRPDARAVQTIHFAVHPLHNPSMLVRAYQPLMDYLNEHVPGQLFILESSRDYANYESKIRTRAPEFLLANPWQCLQAIKVGYTVFATAGEPGDFKGIFLTRKDSGIRTVADLRGKVVAYPARTALAACIMPQWFMHTHGLDVNRDIVNRYVGSQESAIMNAVLGPATVGVTWPPPWRAFEREHPAQAAKLRVLCETPSLINNAILSRDDISPAVREDVLQHLVDLDHTLQGRQILDSMQTARILPATDADYEQVRRFITRFEAEVRPVEER